jgi:hypothetical protein
LTPSRPGKISNQSGPVHPEMNGRCGSLQLAITSGGHNQGRQFGGVNGTGQKNTPKIVSTHEGQSPILLDAESRLLSHAATPEIPSWLDSQFRETIVSCLHYSAGLAAAVQFTKSDYLRFMEDKDAHYYSEFARACDSVLMHYPLGTNEFIRIPGAETSLPEIIRDLAPSRITISSNRIHIIVGVGRGGFGISWEPDEETTNSWAINTFAESLHRVAYVETR